MMLTKVAVIAALICLFVAIFVAARRIRARRSGPAYGSDLRKNIERMHEEAPFARRDDDDDTSG